MAVVDFENVPAGFGTVDGQKAVAGIPGSQTFSGERGDYLELQHSDALALANGTIAMQFNLDATAGVNTLFSKDASGYGDGGHITAYVYNGTLKIRLQSDSTSKSVYVRDNPIGEGEDHHVAFSFGQDGLKVYLNGDLVAAEPTFKGGIEANSESLIIGGNGWSRKDSHPDYVHSPFDGTITDFMVFGSQLTDDQVAKLADAKPAVLLTEQIDTSFFEKLGLAQPDEDDPAVPDNSGSNQTGENQEIVVPINSEIEFAQTEIDNDHAVFG